MMEKAYCTGLAHVSFWSRVFGYIEVLGIVVVSYVIGEHFKISEIEC